MTKPLTALALALALLLGLALALAGACRGDGVWLPGAGYARVTVRCGEGRAVTMWGMSW